MTRHTIINIQQIRDDICKRKAMPPFGPDTSINRLKTINETQRSFTPEVVELLLGEIDVLSKSEWTLADELVKAQKRIAELEARAFNPAILDVIAERHRQQSVEGWTPEHDNAYQNSELADAAACYAIHAHNQGFSTPAYWPWSPDWWKQSGARRDLVKAGALILAEIERIDRAAGIGVKGE
ncbi:hypothetical protein AL515_16520 [Citrobacter sp. FDAARGOS_156]|uniref:hypothetical protein n=1 Tax=Citrobacter sp. FDAARGOS_156 TaxID=1702170 RepID=UPI00076B54D9|nr:hypothetical protein [Citrobacter sp. FDAARGOS_156]AMH15363.1 hypothetical protein AL515_16520 [Citrobacter sp. FDAARGOS_156]